MALPPLFAGSLYFDLKYLEFMGMYLVLEKMTCDLGHLIYGDMDITVDVRRLIVYQMLRGLKCIHSARVLHRDLKPQVSAPSDTRGGLVLLAKSGAFVVLRNDAMGCDAFVRFPRAAKQMQPRMFFLCRVVLVVVILFSVRLIWFIQSVVRPVCSVTRFICFIRFHCCCF